MKLKRILSLLLCALMLIGMIPLCAVAEENNEGSAKPDQYAGAVSVTTLTAENHVAAGGVYSVSNAEELLYFARVCNEANDYFKDATVILTANIDLNPGWTADANAPTNVWTPIALFKGHFDGQNHTVYGIYAQSASAALSGQNENVTGFFAAVWGSVTIENLRIENSYFTSEKNTSALIGFTSRDGDKNRTIVISNVVINANVVSGGAFAAGFIAQVFGEFSQNSTITFNSCAFNGTVQGSYRAAGFIAMAWRHMTFNDCVFAGRVLGTECIGGFVAEHSYGWFDVTFNRCASVGALDINGTRNTSVFAAGFIGKNDRITRFNDCLSAVKFVSNESNAASPYVTSGFLGYTACWDNYFVRCVNLSDSSNPTPYFNQSLIGKVDAKTGNSGGPEASEGYWPLYAEDCFAEINSFEYRESLHQTRAIGMYIGSNTATEWYFQTKYTVGTVKQSEPLNVGYAQKGKLIGDWSYLNDLNQTWLQHAVVDEGGLNGEAGRALLAAYDFDSVWTMYELEEGVEVPVPILAAAILNGQAVDPETAATLDAKLTCGTLDTANKILTDTVDTAEYTFTVETQCMNKMKIYTDEALTKEVKNPVRFKVNGENVYYIKLSSLDGSNTEVWTAKITTTGADLLSYDLTEDVRFFGRTYEYNGAYYMNWSASGFEFSFKGSGAKATFISNADNKDYYAYLKVTVDGTPIKKIPLSSKTQVVSLASELDAAVTHTVRVEMVSGNGKCAMAAVKSLALFDGEKLAAPTAPDGLKMEIIGDSISVGYGVLGDRTQGWKSETEDGTMTYAALAARALGMEYYVTASSGKGIARNYGGAAGSASGKLPDVYTKVDGYHYGTQDWDFAAWQPDVIVINLGTNDADSTNSDLAAQDFQAACAAFLATVREKNPNAYIIYAYGVMSTKFTDEIQAVINDMRTNGDEKISFLKLNKISDAEKTVSSHPSLDANIDRAGVLIEKLKEVFGNDRITVKTPIADLVAADKVVTVDTSLVKGENNGLVDIPNIFDPDKIITGDIKDPPAEENTTAPETETNAPTNENEGGCKSTLGLGSAVSVMTVLTLGGAALRKRDKKKKESGLE